MGHEQTQSLNNKYIILSIMMTQEPFKYLDIYPSLKTVLEN